MPLLLLGCAGTAVTGGPLSWNFVLQAIAVTPSRPTTVGPAATPQPSQRPSPAPSPSPTPHLSGGAGGGGAPSTPTPPGLGVAVQDGGFSDPGATPTLAVGP